MILNTIQDAVRANLHTLYFNLKAQNIFDEPFFQSWLVKFKFSHGELDTQRKVDIVKINSIYETDIASDKDLFLFVYCLDNFYSSTLTLICAKAIDQNYSSVKIQDYLSFKFFRKSNVRNIHPPSNLVFFRSGKNNGVVFEALGEIIENFPVDKLSNHDLIREIFHSIYPREIRHSLGEFYTPDWLVQHVLDKNVLRNDEKTFLDPTCGSGTFLIAVSNMLKESGHKCPLDYIYGIDINPVSAFASKVNLVLDNYLALREGNQFFVNVFNSDVLAVDEQMALADKYGVQSLLDVKNKITEIEMKVDSYTDHELLEIEEIEFVASVFIKDIDHIVGNPPWVNWEYLPDVYRNKTKGLWQVYGLFGHKGMDSSFIKEDISALITYLSIDRFLKKHGSLSFVLKESLLKSAKQAQGFRLFHIKTTNCPIKVTCVEDLTSFKPFSGVNNKTIVLYVLKGEETDYPVDYICWNPKNKKSFGDTDRYEEVSKQFDFEVKQASPINKNDLTSCWSSVSAKLGKDKHDLVGSCFYRARTGVFTGGANAIYWLNVLNSAGKSKVTVKNISERAKIKAEEREAVIEDTLLYPYLSGSELSFWEYSYKKFIICPHTASSKMYPIKENELLASYPLTFDYFKSFETELKARKGFTSLDKKIHDEYFYTLQRIGDYTFAPYKVAWKYISSSFTCAVIEDIEDSILGKRTVIPNEKIIYIGLNSSEEAYYLCGVLSSSRMRELIDSYKISTQIAPSVIQNLNIPKFDPENDFHLLISKACYDGHKKNKDKNECIRIIDTNLMSAISAVQMKSVALPAEIGVQSAFAF